jgi:GTP-binding protein
LDASQPDPVADYGKVRNELSLYDAALAAKPEIVVLNKVDLPVARAAAADLIDRFGKDREVLIASGATSEGVQHLLVIVGSLLKEQAQPAELAAPHEVPVLRPRERDRLLVTAEDGTFVVSGREAEVHALKLGESGDEGLDELQERLRRMGLERALRRAGATPGAKLRIGDVELEWHGE